MQNQVLGSFTALSDEADPRAPFGFTLERANGELQDGAVVRV
jgi:hypothetical protein